MRTYGQFCPIAKAAEIFAERWNPLILRELMLGSRRFNELEYGLPKIPRSLLTQRLRMLVEVGVIERHVDSRGKNPEYYLTAAGQDLFDVIVRLGEWGQKWVNHTIGPSDVDPKLLMWDMHRRVNLDQLPQRRVVVQFDFYGARSGTYWLVLERPEPSVCLWNPGFDVDVIVTTDTVAMHQVWVGHMLLADALRHGLVEIDGPPLLVRAFPDWLALSSFANVPRAARP